ncbi:MAG: enoyl-CoA hydratase/isomerase family protein [Acidobacteriota bacterium]
MEGAGAGELAEGPPTAVWLAKQGLYKAAHASLDEMMDHEEEAQLACFATADCLEGIRAFGERRSPRFQGD